MFKKIFSLLLVFLVATVKLSAQAPKEFSTDPKAFVTEMKAMFSSEKGDPQDVLKQFISFWDMNMFTINEQSRIINLSNQMLKARLRANPDFTIMLSALNAAKTYKVSEDKSVGYLDAAAQVLDKHKRDFRTFNEFAGMLFSDLTLFKNNTRSWKASNSNYTIGFDKSPVINFPGVELQLFTPGDTLGIYETSGKYYPLENEWIGKGGKVYWTRVGFSQEKAYAVLKNYKADLRGADLNADSATLHFPQMLPKPVLGRLQDRALTQFQGDKSGYPRFVSYQNVLELKNIFQNIDYKGGFGLQGAQIQGTGTDSANAQIIIKYDNKKAFTARSKAFTIGTDNIVAGKAAISVYLDKDSVYHSQVVFNYQEKNRTLILSRNEIGLFASPYFDSYHQLEYNPTNVIWKIDEPMINLKSIANAHQPVTFESSQLFNEGKYLRMQGILPYHPLKKMYLFIETSPTRTVTIYDLAGYFNNKPEYLQDMLFQMAREGFIFYDVDGGLITIKDKLMHYVTSFEKSSDYDNIRFESVITAIPNATISLLSKDLEIQGVPKISISDSQNTYLLPANQVVKIKKNRDMSFAGQVHSGRFDFFGTNFYFDYNKFQVNLTDVDSVRFQFPEYDKNGKQIAMRTIQNTIQNVNGFLYIDQPLNKSGRKQLVEYPIFECNKESFVYYDKKNIFNAVYKRSDFFFKVNPFTIKQLDDFTAEGLRFPGTFVSADIIPHLKYDLTIQEDFSLGLIVNSPQAGYNMYKTKGKGMGTFKLSNQGFRADGQIDYLASKTLSNNFLLFPDSTNSNSQTFEIAGVAGGKYPPTLGKEVYSRWRPYQDSMYVYRKKEPISVYAGKVDFVGNLILTPKELIGTGIVKYQNIELASTDFAFMPTNVLSRSGGLKIANESRTKTAVQADDINANLDLNKDFATFKTNKDTSRVELMANRFSTNLNNFTYDLNKKEINFVKNEKTEAEDAYFISTNPELESLKFQSSKAMLSLKEENIKAEDVPFLPIGDAKIFTPNKQITIEREGKIGIIKNAEIVADRTEELHKIYNAHVNIFSQNKFTGFGNYDYIDKNGKKFVLTFADVRTNESGKTIAKGKIPDTANFFVSPGIKYQGNIDLYSTRKDLAFDGYVMPDHKMGALVSNWVKVNDTINPANVGFNITNALGQDGKELFTGIFISSDSNKVYNLLFGKRKTASDREVFSTNGYFYYDENKNEYIVGPIAKVTADEEIAAQIPGNVFIANATRSEVNTDGIYNFGANMEHVSIASAGNYLYKYRDSSHLFDLVMMIDFPLHPEAQKLMVDTIVENSYASADVENSKPSITNAFALLIKDKKEREKVVNELAYNAYVLPADAVNKLFVFTEVAMAYNDSTNSFLSTSYLGLANVNKTTVNKRLEGKIEIKKMTSGDRITILIEPEHGAFIYYSYAGKVMSYLASDLNFDDKIAETAAKFEKGKGGYRQKLATVREVSQFKRKVSQAK